MSKKNLIIVFVLIVIFLAAVIFLQIGFSRKTQQVSVYTEKTEYGLEEFPRVTIKNNFSDSVCFSECYRYYLEEKNGEWKSYTYGDCPWPDLIKRCLEREEAMVLELIIDDPKTGLHRVAIPVCFDCSIGEEFQEDQKFYSNEFIIN